MTRALPLIALLLAMPVPAMAQEEGEEGLMERGMDLFLEGLRREMAPAMEDLEGLARQFGPAMGDFLQEMGPKLADLIEEVEDWSRYEAPEILPNGDIIIRRKPDAPPAPVTPDDLPPPPPGSTDI